MSRTWKKLVLESFQILNLLLLLPLLPNSSLCAAMEDEYKLSRHSGDSVTVELPAMVIVTAVLVFFLVLVFVLLLQLYARWLWSRIEDPTPLPVEARRRRRRRRRFDFSSVQDPNSGRGLDPTVLRSLPVLIFHPENFKDGLECAVCLSEVIEGEKTKLLHDCCHGFHSDCIDMWFQSHSTCPLCRNPVTAAAAETSQVQEEDSASGSSSESPIFPTNVLFWGNQAQVTSAGACPELEESSSQITSPAASSSASAAGHPDAELTIDMHSDLQFPPLAPNEERKLPVATRLRSLKRLLSRQRRVNPCNNTTSPNDEMEQLA
ncbi:RING-H2 finger protein ATL3-like [Momordica charantia]|uniref:RING-type E3 ubiquitin transferase n=1 Tax=Momordica charantia TaxID=3673 RepID=A0A6J1DGS1_MOMCH|nr:RING-H2 finger protein ATL3-like [Momordica charantia]